MEHATRNRKTVGNSFQAPSSKFQTQNGFTLIELVVVIALVAITSLVLLDLFIGHNRLYQTQTSELNVTGDARTALDDISAFVRSANRAQAVYSSFTADSQVLILQIQSVNASNQLIPATFDYAVFYLSSGNLLREVFPDATSTRAGGVKELANNVVDLEFTYNNVDFTQVTEVSTDITVEEDAGIQNRSITLSSQARLRSY
jgi:prepilin-type N-terminal cleavage/methylation domain-containing protein